jgi:PKD repeat protein
VLTTTPATGSVAASFLAPVGPSGPVQATTHGTDTLPSDTTEFIAQEACVWNPKEPPYRFAVTAPDGTEFDLDPPGAGEEHDWHCKELPHIAPIGIWLVKVDTLEAQSLPDPFASRPAHLNPDDLSFSTANFEHQPLLRITGDPGRRPPRDCPKLANLEVVAGCAPGEVTLRATISNLDAAEEIGWNFGDGQTAVGGTPVEGGIQITHTYETDGDGETITAIVTVELPEGCAPAGSPSTLTESVTVPPCESDCPEFVRLEMISEQRCAPGVITFRAMTTNNDAVELWTWNFDDGTEVDGPEDQPNEITHEFTESGPFDVTVSILRPQGCSPRQRMEDITVPACETPPLPPPPQLRCPTLTGVQVDGCTPGQVSFTATGENLGQAIAIGWNFGDGTVLNAGPSVTHTYADGEPRTVRVTVRPPPGCPGPNPQATVQVEPCDDHNHNGPPPEFDWCLLWLVTMIVLFIVAAIATVVAACLWEAVLTPAFWIAFGIALGALILGLIIYIFWMIFCGGLGRRCDLLRILVYFLRLMVTPSVLVGIVLAIFQQWGCLAGAVIDLAWLGVLLVITETIAELVGCARWEAEG